MPQGMITTHILDVSIGKPAQGVGVNLSQLGAKATWEVIARGITDSDGRVRDLVSSPVKPGAYRLSFEVAPYFTNRGIDCFYPKIEVMFKVEEFGSGGPRADHYHVPLLVSPFGYSTYRGS